MVQLETVFIKWYKMLALYVIWYFVAFNCPNASWWLLFFNDGGEFYNECYYMFFNGVKFYKPPRPYVPGASIFSTTPGTG